MDAHVGMALGFPKRRGGFKAVLVIRMQVSLPKSILCLGLPQFLKLQSGLRVKRFPGAAHPTIWWTATGNEEEPSHQFTRCLCTAAGV